MGKKNVISDFRALKGKLDFEGTRTGNIQTGSAAKSNAAKSSSTKGNAQTGSAQATGSDPSGGRELKAGSRVVLMDSDLRGKIVSLGRTVGIELEDGLVIQAAYGEFAVTHDSEISALKRSRVKAHKSDDSTTGPTGPASRNARLKTLAVQTSNGPLSIDLHIEALPGGRSVPKGQQLQFQMETFRRVIRENMPHKGMKINFIHGVGDGILKTAIRKELDEVLALRCTYSVGDPAVTVVSIR